MSWVSWILSCFLHCPLVIEMLKGRALRPQGGYPRHNFGVSHNDIWVVFYQLTWKAFSDRVSLWLSTWCSDKTCILTMWHWCKITPLCLYRCTTHAVWLSLGPDQNPLSYLPANRHCAHLLPTWTSGNRLAPFYPRVTEQHKFSWELTVQLNYQGDIWKYALEECLVLYAAWNPGCKVMETFITLEVYIWSWLICFLIPWWHIEVRHSIIGHSCIGNSLYQGSSTFSGQGPPNWERDEEGTPTIYYIKLCCRWKLFIDVGFMLMCIVRHLTT